MTGFTPGEGSSIPIIEASRGDITWKMRPQPGRYPGNTLRSLADASATFEFTLTEAGLAWARRMIEEADRREWIGRVKRRLGLIGPDDDAAARMTQWEHDHLSVDDLPVALCAGGRGLDTALTLELYGQQVAEVREHPYLTGSAVWIFKPASPLIPWPLRTARCPGCYATMHSGWFDPSCHYSFCWIAHPPPPPLIPGGLLGGF